MLKAVLHNFLETYTSRYSDCEGYWLFGRILDKFEQLEFDLVAGGDYEEVLVGTAANLAAQKFAEQLNLAGLVFSCIRDARLAITKLPDEVEGPVNTHIRKGRFVRFAVRVVSDHGQIYGCEKLVFVAPHDPTVELRRHGMRHRGVVHQERDRV
ncbi:MAG: hypothetical protein K8R36_12535 [Planctomycetales bacterium]|nr:hypothetical protein [Planctomycetales bacterium]